MGIFHFVYNSDFVLFYLKGKFVYIRSSWEGTEEIIID